MTEDKIPREKGSSSGVRIGNVSGGFHNSVVAGRDVSNTSITVGQRTMSVADTPTDADLTELLVEIQDALADLVQHEEILHDLSAAAPFAIRGASESVKSAVGEVAGDVEPDNAAAAQHGLAEAASLVGNVLDTANRVLDTVETTGDKAASIGEVLGQLVEKIAVAAVWVGRIWLGA